jgi:outer membrane lipoprotein-sorting protein
MRPLNFPDLAAGLRIALVAFCLAAVGQAHAAAFDLQALMGLVAQVRSGEAVFTEERRVQQLDRTLLSKGRLSFSAPDTFVRETLQPRHERLAVVGNQLTMSRGNRTQTTLLDSVPEAVVIVEAIRGTLTGNQGTLERYFDTSLQGSAEHWQLELVPRDPRLRGQVTQVRLTGRQGLVREVRISLADGDTSVMRIEPVAAEAPSRP